MSQLNRREFVAAVACAACLCGMGSSSNLLADDAPTTAPSTTLDAGPKSDYTTDGITKTWMKMPNRVAVIRHEGKIYACTTVCTHRGGTLFLKPDLQTMACPRHGAMFDIEGNVTHMPAKTPLTRYAISVDANGHIIVDKSQSFTQDQWNDPASFVAV
jgi:nitrite reductase/ring-hydroxylating ferredoxin subunit